MSIDWKKIAVYLLVVFFAGLLIVKGIIPAWHVVNSDFANYYVSAKLVADKVPLEHLYDNAWFRDKIREYGIDAPGKFSPFPPITAWLMVPLTPFEPLTAQRIFTIVNLLFIAFGVVLLKKLTSWTVTQNTLLILSCGLGLINNIAFGQVYLIMAIFILIVFFLFERGQLFAAGLILGFFTLVKYFPAVIIVGFILNGVLTLPSGKKLLPFTKNHDLILVFYSVSVLMVLLLFQYLYFGKTIMNEYIHSSLIPHLDGELKDQGLFSYQFQSWDNLFRNLFVYDQHANPHPFLNWPNGKILFKITTGLAVTILMLSVLYRFRSFPPSIRRPVFLTLPALVALVFLPASATYHFILLTPSLILILREFYLSRKVRMLVLITYVLIGLIPYTLFFSLAKTYGLLFAYPRLWLVSCLFILVVAGLLKKHRIQHS